MKKLPQYTSIGSYTILYLTSEGETLCAECASKEEVEPTASLYDEGPPIPCDGCGDEGGFMIESSYGEIEERNVE